MAGIAILFGIWPDRYQSDSTRTYPYDPGYRLNQRLLAFIVGIVTLFLPIVMLIGAKFNCLYESISHFYYAQFLGGVFIAALVFIGTFLIAYRGESKRENHLATIAGICAISVALIPTDGRGCEEKEFSGRALADFIGGGTDAFVKVVNTTRAESGLKENPFFELFSGADFIHGISAALLFAFLAWFSFFVFTRVVEKRHLDDKGKLTPQKRNRNIIYIASGIVIVVSMFAIVIGHFFFSDWWNLNNLTFWFESIALWAFGVSWVVKGQFFGAALCDKEIEADHQGRAGGK